MAINAEQNFEVSGTGGAGSSGQGKKYIPGMAALGSSGIETMAQQDGAKMYSAASETLAIPVTGLTAPTEFASQPVTDGAPIGDGANSIPGLPGQQDTTVDKQRLREYLPALEHAASMPDSSEAFRNYVRIVRANL